METVKKHCFCKIAFIIGVVGFLYGAFADGIQPRDLIAVGSVTAVAALCRLAIKPALEPQTNMYESGYEDGYDKGIYEGRRIARPVVVPMLAEHICSHN